MWGDVRCTSRICMVTALPSSLAEWTPLGGRQFDTLHCGAWWRYLWTTPINSVILAGVALMILCYWCLISHYAPAVATSTRHKLLLSARLVCGLVRVVGEGWMVRVQWHLPAWPFCFKWLRDMCVCVCVCVCVYAGHLPSLLSDVLNWLGVMDGPRQWCVIGAVLVVKAGLISIPLLINHHNFIHIYTCWISLLTFMITIMIMIIIMMTTMLH